ncbi:hypothetical protein SEA_SATIS_1 [Streptomyces phage Satis]|nr:hypothetical protein SEA_SATIS_1 [Streptomyces phage Satis]QBZ71900.1 hypothetical protein SEA_KRADAL_1 [Streptomyces phage Kradal]QPL14318.1 hypothetical protein SEA_EHYELIMAYOE_1 [Streptomyces phage EhyElimayoE]
MTTSTECPRCLGPIPEENEETGEGPVYWIVNDTAMCSMECVIGTHRAWLKKNKIKAPTRS